MSRAWHAGQIPPLVSLNVVGIGPRHFRQWRGKTELVRLLVRGTTLERTCTRAKEFRVMGRSGREAAPWSLDSSDAGARPLLARRDCTERSAYFEHLNTYESINKTILVLRGQLRGVVLGVFGHSDEKCTEIRFALLKIVRIMLAMGTMQRTIQEEEGR